MKEGTVILSGKTTGVIHTWQIVNKFFTLEIKRPKKRLKLIFRTKNWLKQR